MRLQNYALTLCFLLCSVSGSPKKQHIKYIPSQMAVDCNGRFYTNRDLDTAAFEACSRFSNQVFCRDYVPWYYVKKCLPAIPRVSIYNGPFYKEDANSGPLLRWPLPKRTPFERAKYHAIIYWNSENGECKALGAIKKEDSKYHVMCKTKPYEQDNPFSFSSQDNNDVRHPQTEPEQKFPEEVQNEFTLPLKSSPSNPMPLPVEPPNRRRQRIQDSIESFRNKVGESFKGATTDPKTK